MKITHVVRQFHPAVGGLENFVLDLSIKQVEQGVAVTVITLDQVFGTSEKLGPLEMLHGIKVIRIPYKGSYKYPLAPAVLKYIADADVVHIHAVDFFLDFLANTHFIHRKNLILSTHGGFFHTKFASKLKKLFFNTMTRFSLRNIKVVSACSEGDFHTFSKIAEKKVKLIENGINIEKFKFIGTDKPLNKRFIFIGRFSNNKRVDLLLDNFIKLCEIDPEYELVIAGKDWDNNLTTINQAIVASKFAKNISLVVDASDQELSELVHSASFITSASDFEGFGMTIIEGMAAGLIPIVSSIPSFSKIVKDSQCGIVLDFTEDNSYLLIHEFITNVVDTKKTLFKECILFSQHYDWTNVERSIFEIYEKVSGKKVRNIQGVKVSVETGSSAVEFLENRIKNNQPVKMAYANSNLINLAVKSPELMNSLSQFYILNDGIGLDIGSKIKYGKSFPENLNGTDFTPCFLKGTSSLRIFLLGAKEESVSKAFLNLKAAFPQHHWVGFHNGYMSYEMELTTKQRIKEQNIDLLLVAMGNPMQEEWIHTNAANLNVKLAIGIGAFFDFYSGNMKRAPLFIQSFRAEWIYRLLSEPKRMWKRYLIGNIIFVKNMIVDKVYF